MQNKIIVALDDLTQEQAEKKILEIISWLWTQSERILFRFTDLIFHKWIDWIVEIIKNLESNRLDISRLHWVFDLKFVWTPNSIETYLKILIYSWIRNIDYITISLWWWYTLIKTAKNIIKSLWLNTKILAITVFTHFDKDECLKIWHNNAQYSVLNLSKIALEAWADGIICSPLETKMIKTVFSDQYNFEIFTPWIRITNQIVNEDDQIRTSTPKDAIKWWSDWLIIWRPITKSNNSHNILSDILREIDEVKYDKSWGEFYELEKLYFCWDWWALLKYIWAFYVRPKNWKFVRLTSWCVSNWYINIWVIERHYWIIEKAMSDLSDKLKNLFLEPNVVIWAQMWSVRLSIFLAKYLNVYESIYTEKDWDEMKLKRHDIDLKWKTVVLSEDVVNRWSTLRKMIDMVSEKWWKVIAITCIINRSWSEFFEWIPLISCYVPDTFEIYYDDKTPEHSRWTLPKLPEWVTISEKPKFDWDNLINSMNKFSN